MSQQKFSIGDSISFGWESMKSNLGFFIAVVLIMWIAEAIFSTPQYYVQNSAVYFILAIISWIVGAFISMAAVKIGLSFVSGKPADFTDLYNEYPKFGKFLLGYILYSLIVLGGLILLIVPGIYWGIKYHFFGYLIIEYDMDPVEAIRRSGHITYGAKWDLLLYFLACIGIIILGFLACFVGIFAAAPTVLVATAHVYRSLLSAEYTSQQPTATGGPGAPASPSTPEPPYPPEA